jgi:hypothetical protein
MIKFITEGGGRQMIGLGLSDGNLGKLWEGQPIHIMAEELGIGFDLLIFWGKNEQAMQAQLTKLGLITEKTEVKEGFVEQ